MRINRNAFGWGGIALAAMLAMAPGKGRAQSELEQAATPGFKDTSAEYKYGPMYREPGIYGFVPKSIISATYVDGGKMWSNFANGDLLFSMDNDPSKGNGSGAQAVEFYGLYRGDLSLNQAFGTKMFTVGKILRDVSAQIGFDANTKNTNFAPAKKLIVFGPDFHFNTPGFLNVALQFSQEWNYNGIVDKTVSFKPAFEVEIVWSHPLTFTGLPLVFQGFFNYVGPKGTDGFGNGTKVEILTEPRLTLDIGHYLLKVDRKLDFSIGYQYWLNKFGNNHNTVPGSLASTVFFAMRYHF
jgi:nucleoside-specific outer membrane channel protein Tsx